MSFPIPDPALAAHTAVLGKTGSGKSSTARLIVEQVVAKGFRVCVLDSVKSDWWGITSSADGRNAGLPFRILGGPRGHVPLPSSAGKVIGQLVGQGSLPHVIIDMADFEAGGLQRFFTEFAPALLRSMTGVVYLVIEEAHEFAPKERAGIGAENLAIHWAKKLATAGRTKGIRLIVVTQRTQSLHNALLGSCETMIAHRLTTPADQEPVLRWLKANAMKFQVEKVGAEIASLPTGTGWVCSGEAQMFERIAFPKFLTFDNTKTPEKDAGTVQVATALVDTDALRQIIGHAVEEAEASDPKLLRRRILDLERELAKSAPAPATTHADIQAALQRGFDQGYARGSADERQAIAKRLARPLGDTARALKEGAAEIEEIMGWLAEFLPESPREAAVASPPRPLPGDGVAIVSMSHPVQLDGPQQRVLDSLAWWEAAGIKEPTRTQVAIIADYSPNGGAFARPLSGLRTMEMIDYRPGSVVVLTARGRAQAKFPKIPGTLHDLHQHTLALLDGPMRRVLEPLLDVWPETLSREQLAKRANYAMGGAFARPLSGLRSLGLIDYRPGGAVVAEDILFPEISRPRLSGTAR